MLRAPLGSFVSERLCPSEVVVVVACIARRRLEMRVRSLWIAGWERRLVRIVFI